MTKKPVLTARRRRVGRKWSNTAYDASDFGKIIAPEAMWCQLLQPFSGFRKLKMANLCPGRQAQEKNLTRLFDAIKITLFMGQGC